MTRVLPCRPAPIPASLDLSGKGDPLAPRIYYGLGSPEGKVAGVTGSWYLRRDGGAGSTLYVKESLVVTRVPAGLETGVGADASAISGRVWPSGGLTWESGIGLYALGSSIQSNHLRRTAAGSGGTTQHNALGDTMPFDNFEMSVALTRGPDAVNQVMGFGFRCNHAQFNGVTNDGIYAMLRRTNAATAQVELLVQKQGVNGQNPTIAAGVAWAENVENVLGVQVIGATVRFWMEPGLGGSRTYLGATVTLAPDTFNDAGHRTPVGLALLPCTPNLNWKNFKIESITTAAATATTGWTAK